VIQALLSAIASAVRPKPVAAMLAMSRGSFALFARLRSFASPVFGSDFSQKN
jgi:hypothetical protein